MSDRPVLVTSGVASVMPLMKPLSDVYDLAIIHGEAAEHFRLMELPIVPLQQLVTGDVAAKALTGATKKAAKIVNSLGGGKISRKFKQAMPPKTTMNLDDWFPGWVHDTIRREIALIEILDQLLEARNVAGVVLHEDTTEAFATTACWAKARELSCIHVPHAVYHRPETYGGPGTDIHDVITTSHIAACGSYQADWYKERGNAEVVITGSPRWDEWALMQVDKTWARTALGLEDKETWVYLSSWVQATSAFNNPASMWHAYELVLQAAKEAEVQLIVKTHPSGAQDDEQKHVQVAQQLGVDCAIMRPYLDLALQASDKAISYGPSNALVEAMLIGVPGTTLHFAGAFEGSGWITYAEGDVDNIIEAVNRDRTGRDELIEKMAFKADGRATERVVNLVKDICQ